MEMKIILGDEFNKDRWIEIKDSGVVPAYLMDVQISGAAGVVTRGNLPEAPADVSEDVIAAGTTAPTHVQVTTDDSDDVLDELVDDETRSARTMQIPPCIRCRCPTLKFFMIILMFFASVPTPF